MTDIRFWAIKHFKIVMDGDLSHLPAELSPQDNAFVNMLTKTAWRHLPYIRSIIENLCTQKISHQKPIVRYALILGVAEILYLNSPDYAVINAYVEIAKKQVNRFAGGFVNAVLRKIATQKSDLITQDKGKFFSAEFRSLLQKSYSDEVVLAIEKSALSEPALDITLLDDSSPIVQMGELLPMGTLRIRSKGKISDLPDYTKGNWLVQDFASALPVKMLSDLSGQKVLDVCAAPGGKTAQLIAKGANVTALDISSARLDILRQNLTRLHLKAQNIICADALEYLRQSDEIYDVALLDAPCSATGTLRRHPEIASQKGNKDIIKSAVLQKQLLDSLSHHIAPRGQILYCTCSMFPQEGEEQIDNFLKNHSGWQLQKLNSLIPSPIAEIASPHGWLRILPCHLVDFGGADGFFVALLKRQS